MKAVIDNEIRLCDIGNEVGLKKFRLSTEEVVAFFDRMLRSQKENDAFYIDEAVRLLRVEPQTVYNLVKRGIINAVKTANGSSELMISRTGIQAFKATYIRSSKVSWRFKISPAEFANTLMSHGIQPITGPTIDGSRQYVFDRSDLRRLNLRELFKAPD
ncbi:MAG: helix-turn-helix domain-containing protein [Acidobacteria bacterium]|nr:helix-turn-helix domain-containing protein [Acidobacteriota bacterium]